VWNCTRLYIFNGLTFLINTAQILFADWSAYDDEEGQDEEGQDYADF
jgi:hypothetical protein